MPALHHHPYSGRGTGEGGGNVIPGSFLSHRPPPHPWLFPPLQAAGLGREQRLEQGQEAGSGAAGNAGSSGEGGEQGPGLLFHFLWKENWRKNRRRESPPPRPSGNLPWVGAGSGGPWRARVKERDRAVGSAPLDERSRWGGWLASFNPSRPGKDSAITGSRCSGPHKPLVCGQPRPGGPKHPCSLPPKSCPCLSNTPSAPALCPRYWGAGYAVLGPASLPLLWPGPDQTSNWMLL